MTCKTSVCECGGGGGGGGRVVVVVVVVGGGFFSSSSLGASIFFFMFVGSHSYYRPVKYICTSELFFDEVYPTKVIMYVYLLH